MNRQRMLRGLDIARQQGLEIGALDKPVVRRADGPILYADHADTATLRRKYDGNPDVDAAAIVDVDAIWGDCTLREAVGPDRALDYVIACHVVEHVPDLVGWLAEIREILRPGGELRLLVPDRRYTFDRLRQATKFSEIVHAHLVRARKPLPLAILDHVLEVAKVDPGAAWSGRLDEDRLVRWHDLAHAEGVAVDALRNGTYHDVHVWVFTPRSFALLMARAAELGLIGFACVDVEDTPENDIEFYVALRPAERDEAAASWRRMAAAVRHDDAARTRLAALEASTIWRASAPLRRLVNAARGWRRG